MRRAYWMRSDGCVVVWICFVGNVAVDRCLVLDEDFPIVVWFWMKIFRSLSYVGWRFSDRCLMLNVKLFHSFLSVIWMGICFYSKWFKHLLDLYCVSSGSFYFIVPNNILYLYFATWSVVISICSLYDISHWLCSSFLFYKSNFALCAYKFFHNIFTFNTLHNYKFSLANSHFWNIKIFALQTVFILAKALHPDFIRF